jgi:hemoglobin
MDQQSPFDALGPDLVRSLALRFYDEMEAHEPALTRVHKLDEHGRIAAETREHFASFLAFWLGGPQDYLQTRGHPRLRMRHAHVAIGAELRDAWLRSMTRAMDGLGIQGPVRSFLDARFAHTADFLRNVPGDGA